MFFRSTSIGAQKFGCRLVGMIPCSDAFGVDLLIERYEEALIERKKLLEMNSLK